ncbi:MAG: PAS domain S-box protein [Limisphaerales bacterium]
MHQESLDALSQMSHSLTRELNLEKLPQAVASELAAHQRVAQELRASEECLAADLRDMTRLYEVGSQCVNLENDFDQCLESILDAAISILGADKGNLQLADSTGTLIIRAQRGFDEPFLAFFNSLEIQHRSACGAAMRSGRRTVAEDVTVSDLFKEGPAKDVLLAAGVRAVQSTPLLASGGNLLGVVSTHFARPHLPAERQLRLMDLLARQAADYVERRRTEEMSARLAAIVDHSDDAIISKDLCGTIKTWNKGAERLFGYRADEAVGKPVTLLIPPERADEEPDILRRLRRGEHVDHYETVRRRKNGTLLNISLTVSPIKDARGQIIGASKIARDIDDRKRADERLEKTVAERTASLREAIAQMEEFSYTVSHDLRAPLRAMQGYSQTLLQDFAPLLPEEAQRAITRIAENATHLERMILDVLNYSKVARRDIRLETVNLDLLARRVVEQHPGMQLPAAEIQIDPLPEVLGHEPSLSQALCNLLNNAVKFVAPRVRPKVHVWAENGNGRVRVWIEDNGIGINPEYQHKVFHIFEQIHPHLKYEGTGIGLAIVRKAVERMGGAVGMESDGVHGSRFWMELKPVG